MIRTVLVANRGEIARRVFRTARAIGIGTVAVFSDADAGMPFVREADHAVRLPGNTPAETYLHADTIVAAARAAGADAIHPGYGFLSENAAFARAVTDAGLTWIGPPPAAIESMGSKLESKRMMREAGVPTLPWAEDVAGADEVGYPLLVKASAGGGGRGMRIVRDAADLSEAVEGAQREAGSAFGDATVFLERYLDAPRHVEVQVFADTHGNVVSLFERECSIQRRHQKIIEEAPSPAVDDALRKRIGDDAIAAAKAVGYVGAGTVEFVLAPDGQYYFLEMNTRLQVEHPVTELITGLDLVRLQFLVAAGSPLPPEALAPRIVGHAIEVRLYAEDVQNGFLPVTGTISRFAIPDGVRVDSGVESGSVISPYYDAMIAKVVAHARTRAEAAGILSTALRRAHIHGLTTNRDLLAEILREPEFLAGGTDTAYLERHDPAELGAPMLMAGGAIAHAVVATLALQAVNRGESMVQQRIPSGWRNNVSRHQEVVLEVGPDDERTVRYLVSRAGALTVTVDGHPVEVELHAAASHVVDATINGVRRRYHVVIAPDRSVAYVDSPLGASTYRLVPRFADPTDAIAAGSLVAPMPGAVVRVMVEAGATVAKGQALVVLEAMKMEHTVSSPTDGTVTEVRVTPGQQVDAGSVLAVVDDA